MRPSKPSISTQGSLGGQQVALSVDQESLGHIMQLLTDPYSDPAMAVLREYSTNAADAHEMAGNSRPIEVNTPSAFNAQLEIIDYGVGLSPDDIIDVYSKYAKSTKRENDDQVGTFGVGCKSALAYASQFTMTAVKDGLRSHAIISRDDSGSGIINIPKITETDAPNGVKITVPASVDDRFESKARHLFKFWPSGSVLLDGQEPDKIDGLWIDDNVCLIDNTIDNNSDSYIVMGGVPYQVDREHIIRSPQRFPSSGHQSRIIYPGVVAWVEMGSVDFPISREGLTYSDKTLAKLAELRQHVEQKAAEAANQQLQHCESYTQALITAASWRKRLEWITTGLSLYYNNESIPELTKRYLGEAEFELNNNVRNSQKFFKPPLYRGGINAENLNDYLLIYNFQKESLNTADRQKIHRYVNQQNANYSYACLTSNSSPDKWLTDLAVVDWDVVAQYKAPKTNNQNTNTTPQKPPESFEIVRNDTGNLYWSNEIDPNKRIVYTSPALNLGRDKTILDEKQNLGKIFSDWVIIVLARNRWNKFKRSYPHAYEVTEAISKVAKEITNSLSERDKIHARYNSHSPYPRMRSQIDPSRIEDPQAADFLRKYYSRSDDLQSVERFRMCAWFARVLHIEDFPSLETPPSPFDTYPLLGSVDRDHLYEYVNALYRYRQQGE